MSKILEPNIDSANFLVEKHHMFGCLVVILYFYLINKPIVYSGQKLQGKNLIEIQYFTPIT